MADKHNPLASVPTAGFQCAGSPLFEEFLTLSQPGEPTACDVLGPDDALVIIDMQADFVPRDASNPKGGRFGVAEGNHVVDEIGTLIDAAVRGGSTIVASRDYHPVDHISFDTQGGIFPTHCVQGSDGSKFLPELGAKLAFAMKVMGSEKVMVVFKAFHEDVDSFGAVPYWDGGEGRIAKGKRATMPEIGTCLGCAKAPWSGSLLLKTSSMVTSDGIDIDAPPDVLATLIDGVDRCASPAPAASLPPTTCAHHARSDSDRGCARLALGSGMRTLQEVLKGKKRIFVCGLALDFCVMDTCLNAAHEASGLTGQEIHMVLDAARAAHIPGIGPHGTGFLSDPKEVAAKLKAAGVSLVSTGHVTGDYRDPERSSSPAAAAESFPHCLGPLGLLAAAVDATIKDGKYSLVLASKLQMLSGKVRAARACPHDRRRVRASHES